MDCRMAGGPNGGLTGTGASTVRFPLQRSALTGGSGE